MRWTSEYPLVLFRPAEHSKLRHLVFVRAKNSSLAVPRVSGLASAKTNVEADL
jgi:hypothetical protein